MIKKLLALTLMLCTIFLISCTVDGGSENKQWSLNADGEKVKIPKCTDYGTKDVSYTVEVSDGKRSVTLDAERHDGITVATVTSPEALAGTVITDDTEGMRMIVAGECELPLSPEASAGLAAVFAVYLPIPEEANVTDEREVEFLSGDYTVRLKLTEDGYPDTATLKKDGAERQVKFIRREG